MKIVVADRNLTPHRGRFETQLPAGSTVVWHCGTTAPDLAEAQVFVGSTFTASMARSAKKLRLVHVPGAGTDGIDFGALPTGVLVANTFHHENSIAEYVVATSILMWRRILDQDRRLRSGVWTSPAFDSTLPQLDAISAAHVGFVGFGHIGRSSWNLLRVLGCKAAAVTGRGFVEGAVGLSWTGGPDRLDQLIAESDVLVVSAPLSERTRGMIGEAQLRALGPRGVLINVGRGPLVDEKALYTALSNRDIAGAAIDVWFDYPNADGIGAPSELPFADLENLVMTPHTSGITRQTFLGRVDDITANIGRLQRGEPLANIVAK